MEKKFHLRDPLKTGPLAGFTLIEALIVMALTAVLLSVGLSWWASFRSKLKNKECLTKLTIVLKELQLEAKRKKLQLEVRVQGETLSLTGGLTRTYTFKGCNFTNATFGVNLLGLFIVPTDGITIKNLSAPSGEADEVKIDRLRVFSP